MPQFTSTLTYADERAIEDERAKFIIEHGVYDLRFCGGRDGVPLWYVVTIAEQPHEVQYSMLASGLKVPEPVKEPAPETILVDAVVAQIPRMSREQRDRLRAELDSADAKELAAESKPSGVLFPDVAAEIEFTEKRMEPTEEEFQSFYMAYPRRVDKKRARVAFYRAFKALRKKHGPEESISVIMNGVAVYAKHVDKDAICHPTTWLNGARWEDDPEGIGNKPAVQQRANDYGEYREKTPEEYAVF